MEHFSTTYLSSPPALSAALCGLVLGLVLVQLAKFVRHLFEKIDRVMQERRRLREERERKQRERVEMIRRMESPSGYLNWYDFD